MAQFRAMSTTLPRRVAMRDGGRAADDIDLAFDYPSDAQATYTTPAGYHQERIDKEMGYPDQRLLYALIAGIGLASLYNAVGSIIYGPADHYSPPATATNLTSTATHPITTTQNTITSPIPKVKSTIAEPIDNATSKVKSTISKAADTATSKMKSSAKSSSSPNITVTEPITNTTPSPVSQVNTATDSIGNDASALLGGGLGTTSKTRGSRILGGGREEERFVTVKKEGEKDKHLPSHPPTESKLERLIGRGG